MVSTADTPGNPEPVGQYDTRFKRTLTTNKTIYVQISPLDPWGKPNAIAQSQPLSWPFADPAETIHYVQSSGGSYKVCGFTWANSTSC